MLGFIFSEHLSLNKTENQMKKLVIAALLCSLVPSIYAQNSVSLCLDAPSLYFNGYSFEAGFNHRKTRVSISFTEIEVPDFANIDFETAQKGEKPLDLKLTKFIRDDQRGLHFGVNTGLVIGEKFNLLDSLGNVDPSVSTESPSYFKVGATVGCFWHPFIKIKGLYLEPNIGLSYAIGQNDILLGAQIIDQKPVTVEVPRLNIVRDFILNNQS